MVETLFTVMFLASLFGMPLAVVAGVVMLVWPPRHGAAWHMPHKRATAHA
jgi:hypothetical protein